jgi:chorismate mutase/prephenate dehydratase
LATLKYFGPAAQLCPVASIAAVFESVVRQEAEYGVVPIENSTDGRVVDTLGMFLKHRVQICAEVQLPIHHNLLSRTGRNEIREVHSKPQALSQCRGWLAQNLPEAKLVEVSSTAAAAKLAAEHSGVAAVASIEAATRYGLNVVQANIEDNRNNVTRFAILGNSPNQPTGNDKTAILFQVAHQPGALADTMNLFKKGGLNLTWIESFPLPGSTNEYLFFVELEGHAGTAKVGKTLEQLRKRAQRLEILGSYPRSARPT